MTDIKIGIIGAGPKAAAIAAKAHCLNNKLQTNLKIVVFERTAIGSNWDGSHGYTDGRQRLCTPAERDIGFPYASVFGPDVVRQMQQEFSWTAFLVASGRYKDWVNRGRHRPTHEEFAEYLNFCFRECGVKPRITEVKKLSHRSGRWTVHSRRGKTDHTESGFNAIVVTGPGPATSNIKSAPHARIFDGVSFWRDPKKIELFSRDNENEIVVIGSGGTAAAIAGWLTSRDITNRIVILGSQASMFARVDNAFENRVFTDGVFWASLSADSRRQFTDRLTRGAVWSNVLDQLSHADNVSYIAGRAKEIRVRSGLPAGDELYVDYINDATGVVNSINAGTVINATGFDDMWFTALLSRRAKAGIGSRSHVQEIMSDNLVVASIDTPPLHAPMLSQVKSPSYVSLMALGDMADAILQPYAV